MAREWISNEGNEWEGCWNAKCVGKNKDLDRVASKIVEKMKYYDQERIRMIDKGEGSRDEWCTVSDILLGLEEAMMCLIEVVKEGEQNG